MDVSLAHWHDTFILYIGTLSYMEVQAAAAACVACSALLPLSIWFGQFNQQNPDTSVKVTQEGVGRLT